MTEEDKNSSPLDEGTEIIAHTAQTAYATTAAVAAGGTAAGMAAGTALAGLWSGHWYPIKLFGKYLFLFSCFVFSGCLLLQI